MVAHVVAGEVSAMSSKYKWVISNFCMGCCKNIGDYVESPKFTTRSISGGIQWHLRLYPKGDKEATKNCFSLYLYADKEFKAVASFKLLNDKGKVLTTSNLSESVFGDNSGEAGTYPGWGFERFVKPDFILDPANGILIDNKITIACEITRAAHEEKEADQDSTLEKVKETDNILQRLEEIDKYDALINDGKFSDVSLVSEGKALKVYKGILAKSSTVFAAMFGAEMKEKLENTVEIADIKYDVLVEMVRFVYSGKVNNIDTIACELAAAADKYAIHGLKAMCEETMCKNLSVDNVVEYLDFADKYRMDKLKKKSIEFSVAHANDVIEKPEFQLLPCNVMYEVCRAIAKKK